MTGHSGGPASGAPATPEWARARALSTGQPADGLAFLATLPPSAIKMGLERVRAALAVLGNPEQAFPALHVAGTNGKGSTCALAAAALGQRFRVGLYTSPHLVRPNERIRVDGTDIDDVTFGRRIIEVLERLPASSELTWFELATVVAFWHFAQEGVDLAVVETGLGGRLDASTACRSLVTAITAISFDHMEYLGTTLRAIAAEKAGIMKPGVPLITSHQGPEVMSVFDEAARRLQCPWLHEGRDFELRPLSFTPGGAERRFEFFGSARRLDDLTLPLRGPHQRHNLAVSLACLEVLGERGFPLTTESLVAGIRSVRWPGRLEEVATSPTTVLDGAHNPAGAQALIAALDEEYPGRSFSLVFGVLADKDFRPMLETLFPRCGAVYLTPVPSPRGLDPLSYLGEAQRWCPRTRAFPTPTEALAAARAEAGDAVVVCAGSLFLLGQLRPLLVASKGPESP